MSDRPAFYDSLDLALAEAWRLAEAGPRDRRSPFHTPTLATTALDGRPRARTVVIRGVDPEAGTLRFHCDRRSDKFAEMAADPRVALHAYCRESKIQVRFEGRATLHTADTSADEAWEGSRASSRVCYGTSPAPGSPIGEGGGFVLPQADAEIAAGRENFAAVLVRAESLEFLYLAFDGHRRARFAWGADGTREARWLVP